MDVVFFQGVGLRFSEGFAANKFWNQKRGDLHELDTENLSMDSRKMKRQALTNWLPIQTSHCGLSHLRPVKL